MFIVSDFLGSPFWPKNPNCRPTGIVAFRQETCDGKDVRSVVKGLGQAIAGPVRGICLVFFRVCVLPLRCIRIYLIYDTCDDLTHCILVS